MALGPRLLVVAGESSGDLFAAPVVERLGVRAFGLGGRALDRLGCRLLMDPSELGVMGLGRVLAHMGPILGAWRAIEREIRRERPGAALLVGFSEFNARLGPRLRRRGVRVLWYAPPQIWAWRPGRAARLSRAADVLALILPFEPEVWRPWRVRAEYVGHPVLELTRPCREAARAGLGAPAAGELVALLPGSRAQEVDANLPSLLAAAAELRRRRPALGAHVLLSPNLGTKALRAATHRAEQHGIPVHSCTDYLAAFDVALAVSGTVTLEAAVAGVPPVIVYKTGRLLAWGLSRLLDVPWIGLPNLVLGEPAFVELVGPAATGERIANEADRLLDRLPEAIAACERVKTALGRGIDRPPSARVADLLRPWLFDQQPPHRQPPERA